MTNQLRPRWNVWKKALLTAGIAFVAAALLINPRLTNPPVTPGQDLLASNRPPAEIVSVLRNACYDCHSHETQWPWYSHVAPVSWWVAEHVEHGREELNFSTWPHDDAKRAARRLRNMGEVVATGEMPLPSYLKGHPEARLTREQRDSFARWADQEADRLLADAEKEGQE